MQATVDTGPCWPHSPRVAVALVSVLSPLGCNHGTSASGASTAPPGSVPTATIPEIAPSGGPTPAKLQGSWELVSKSGKTFKNRFELVIPARHYGFSIGLVRGEIVAQGNEVDLYNEDLCGLAFPKGVGRYRWALAGEMLHLDLIGKDPRARAGVLNDATYRRERLTKRRLLLSTTAAAPRASVISKKCDGLGKRLAISYAGVRWPEGCPRGLMEMRSSNASSTKRDEGLPPSRSYRWTA
jgi:hypothetical protein